MSTIKFHAQEGYEAQLERMRGELATKDRQIATAQRDLINKDELVATQQRELVNKDEFIATQQRELANKDEQIATQQRDQPRDLLTMLQVPPKLALQLRWYGPDMPFGMEGYVQSVVVQKRVYVGGGSANSRDDNYIVMEYDTSSGEWAKLPSYKSRNFAMTVINNQLVLVGGEEHGCPCKALGVWRPESNEWTHLYPEMPTARYDCSAVFYTEWLVVAGGWGDCVRLSSVEVLNINSKQWYAGPTPTPLRSMKTAIVGETCYYMGGYCGRFLHPTAMVYSVSLPALISQLQDSGERGIQHQIWKEASGLQTACSTPLNAGGSLLAVGGMDKDGRAVTAIRLYQPDTGEWVKVGDLPTPRCHCTCAMITDRSQEILVTGGHDNTHFLSNVDIALMTTQEL
jgi:hypothetical protein